MSQLTKEDIDRLEKIVEDLKEIFEKSKLQRPEPTQVPYPYDPGYPWTPSPWQPTVPATPMRPWQEPCIWSDTVEDPY